MQTRSKSNVGGALIVVGLLSLFAGLSVQGAGASGEFTTVTLTSPVSGTSTTFTWSYAFQQNGGHDLSNIALGFCSQSILDHVVSASPDAELFKDTDVSGGHTGFGHGIKFAVTATTGTLLVTFDQAYAFGPNGVFIQSHSGDGEDPDATTAGDGPLCDPGTTTTSTSTTSTSTTSTSTTTSTTSTILVPPTVPGVTTTVPVTTTVKVTTTVPVTTTLPGTTTTPVASTALAATTTVPSTTTTTTTTKVGATTTSPPLTAVVLSESQSRDVLPAAQPRLATTGSAALLPLVALGALLMAIGLALVVGDHLERPLA